MMKLPLTLAIVALATSATFGRDLVPAAQTVIFPKERARELLGVCYQPPEGVSGFWTPSEKDLTRVEDGLEPYLAEMRAKKGGPPPDSARWLKWEDYFRQVIGVEIGGERFIFISYYHGRELKNPKEIADMKAEYARRGKVYDPDWWKQRNLIVSDGGYAYFRVLFDPRKRKFVWHEQNGTA